MIKIPLWLKIFLVFVMIFLVGSVLGAVAEYLIPVLTLLALILFPGSDPQNPRLVKVIPWLWIFSGLFSVVFLIANYMGKEILGPEATKPSNAELWATTVFTPVLAWLCIVRHRFMKIALVVSSIVMIGLAGWDFFESARDFKATANLCGDFFSEIILTVYLVLKFQPRDQN